MLRRIFGKSPTDPLINWAERTVQVCTGDSTTADIVIEAARTGNINAVRDVRLVYPLVNLVVAYWNDEANTRPLLTWLFQSTHIAREEILKLLMGKVGFCEIPGNFVELQREYGQLLYDDWDRRERSIYPINKIPIRGGGRDHWKLVDYWIYAHVVADLVSAYASSDQWESWMTEVASCVVGISPRGFSPSVTKMIMTGKNLFRKWVIEDILSNEATAAKTFREIRFRVIIAKLRQLDIGYIRQQQYPLAYDIYKRWGLDWETDGIMVSCALDKKPQNWYELERALHETISTDERWSHWSEKPDWRKSAGI